ncbi:hypothetical protein G6F36_013437 [Rhizopus arrhizus]|nr:hypothetical protein G6F36_013437 [Rhizopus arrhizus]
MAPAKKSTGKKVAPAPYPIKGKQTTKASANPLIEKTPKNFGIGKMKNQNESIGNGSFTQLFDRSGCSTQA